MKRACNLETKSLNKSDFYKEDTKLFQIKDIDVNKILISTKKICSKKTKSSKYMIGYDDNDEILPLIIRFPQMIGYYNCSDNKNKNKNKKSNNKTMPFKYNDK